MLLVELTPDTRQCIGVFEFDEAPNENFIEITKEFANSDMLFYCYHDGKKFVGFYSLLSYRNNQVTATIYDYLGDIAFDYSSPIRFEYEGEVVEVLPVDGVAVIDFEVEVGTGEHIVKTVNEGIRNGEVVIHV